MILLCHLTAVNAAAAFMLQHTIGSFKLDGLLVSAHLWEHLRQEGRLVQMHLKAETMSNTNDVSHLDKAEPEVCCHRWLKKPSPPQWML